MFRFIHTQFWVQKITIVSSNSMRVLHFQNVIVKVPEAESIVGEEYKKKEKKDKNKETNYIDIITDQYKRHLFEMFCSCLSF